MKKIVFVLIALAVGILFISCPQANSDNQSPPPPNILYLTATLNDAGTEITITEATDGTENQLRAALSDLNHTKGNITKITIVAPENGARITPEPYLNKLFGGKVAGLTYTNLKTIEGLEHIDTSNVTDISYMFQNCSSLTSLDGLNNWDVSNVDNVSGMFFGCTALTNISALKNWNTSSVELMINMFYECSALTSIVKCTPCQVQFFKSY